MLKEGVGHVEFMVHAQVEEFQACIVALREPMSAKGAMERVTRGGGRGSANEGIGVSEQV